VFVDCSFVFEYLSTGIPEYEGIRSAIGLRNTHVSKYSSIQVLHTTLSGTLKSP